MTATDLDPRSVGTTTAAADPERSSTRSAWLLVARREVMVKATDRSFLVGTLVTVGILIAVTVLQIVLAGSTSTYDVATTASSSAMTRQVAAAASGIDEDVVVRVRTVPDDAAARAAVLDESADAWLHQADGGWVLTTKSEPNFSLTSVVEEVVRKQVLQANAAAVGTTVAALERGAELQTQFLEGDAQRAELVSIIAFAFAFLFYLGTLLFGVSLANSVLEEKQSRIVEIIATAIPIRHLLAGKVVGNTVLAFAQLVLFVGVGLVGLAFTDFSSLVSGITAPVIWFVIFFVAGFASLACLWAVAGSLAGRTEDLQSTTTPLTMLVVGMLFAGMLLEGRWQAIASYVPPTSAVVMPIRLLRGDAGWPQALIALALLLVAGLVAIRVGERIYRRSLLRSGGRVSVRQAWTAQD